MYKNCVGYLIGLVIGISTLPFLVAARLCEGGHRCSPPKECCPQGCCYLYAPPSAPRSPPPATDHVLNLFFISHWYFWCLVVAIILAILCACSLWKKRRQFCGWGSNDNHAQSEGDSAGSCYAPPQYSRCSSFHHPPPPYTEVTSKPDLYPLVFSCNGDNGKTGASYLMVQYFRNYIVRPAGSLSATSTVDSLSSSFICTANEANTLVPPPYSRAASPSDNALNSNYSQHFMMPRSASQLACAPEMPHNRNPPTNVTNNNSNVISSSSSSGSQPPPQHGTTTDTTSVGGNTSGIPRMSQLRNSESFQHIRYSNNGSVMGNDVNTTVMGSQSDQQFRYTANSNSSISDIFVNTSGSNGCTFGSGGESIVPVSHQQQQSQQQQRTPAQSNFAYQNSSPNRTNQHHPHQQAFSASNSNNPLYNSCSSSIGGISITVPVATDGESDYRDLDVLRRSLETCCQILQQQQMPSGSFVSEDSPGNVEMGKKFDAIRSYVTSTTCSAVSSLANIGSPSSPPQATSPTGEVKELLEQIRQLQQKDRSISECDEIELFSQSDSHGKPPSGLAANASNVSSSGCTNGSMRRPSTLQGKKKFFSKPNKAMYIPINTCNVRSIRSPVGAAGSFLGRGRGRRGWISRSAPSTPGTTLPPSRLGDDSPLLNEHDEDAEQNA